MVIIPAIDLYQGKVVRLTKGDPRQAKVYSDNPVETARKWEKEGARLIHLVDLSSALGQGDNLVSIKEIIKSIKIAVEVGGGIRDIKKAKDLISSGAQRVIIGTKGLEKGFIENALKVLGKDRVAVSADIDGAYVAARGWQEKTTVKYSDFMTDLEDKGVRWVIYTDISRDGTLSGVNLGNLKQLSVYKKFNLIISGGISSVEDIENIKRELPFVWGVIAGKALYEGKFTISEANSIIGASVDLC